VYAVLAQGVQENIALGLFGGAIKAGNVHHAGLGLSPRRTPAFSAMRLRRRPARDLEQAGAVALPTYHVRLQYIRLLDITGD